MKFSLNHLVLAAAVAALTLGAQARPLAATAGQIINAPSTQMHVDAKTKCTNPSEPCPTCIADLSAQATTSNQVYISSGQFILASQPIATEALCAKLAVSLYKDQVQNHGWDPTSTCGRAAPTDTIMVYMTYVYNNGPSTRVDGYAYICSPLIPVPGTNPL